MVFVSVFALDIGGISHVAPFNEAVAAMRKFLEKEAPLLGAKNFFVSYVGDGIVIGIVHNFEAKDRRIHGLVWNVFQVGLEITAEMKGYAAGQDVAGEFRGDMEDVGAQVLEMKVGEEDIPYLLINTDKVSIGALNAVALAYADPRINPGLMVSPKMRQGYVLTIMDTSYQGPGKRIIRVASSEMVLLYTLLFMQGGRFALQGIASATTGITVGIIFASSPSLHDDPIGLFCTQGECPIASDILRAIADKPIVSGGSRGLFKKPFRMVSMDTGASLENPILGAQIFGVSWCQDFFSAEAAELFSMNTGVDQIFLNPDEAETSVRRQIEELEPRFEVVGL